MNGAILPLPQYTFSLKNHSDRFTLSNVFSSWVPSQLRLAVIIANSSLSCTIWDRVEALCRVHSLIFCNSDFLFPLTFLFPSVLPCNIICNMLYSSCRIKWPKYDFFVCFNTVHQFWECFHSV